MRALTIWQPWASFLLAVPERPKRNETRGWSTRYRGPLVVHAAKTEPGWVRREFLAAPALWPLLDRLPTPFGLLPRGCVLGVVDLVDVVPVEELRDVGATESALGDYAAGRYAWITRNPRALVHPVPYPGRQGLWGIPDALLDAADFAAHGVRP